MKLLFDQNLSFKLCRALSNLFPGSAQLRQIGLDRADDRTIWQQAKGAGFVLVTMDSDFADLAALLGSAENHLVALWQPEYGRAGENPARARRSHECF